MAGFLEADRREKKITTGLAERCAKAPGFRWMAGMIAQYETQGYVRRNRLPEAYAQPCDGNPWAPDISDPTTLACIQWLARERHSADLRVYQSPPVTLPDNGGKREVWRVFRDTRSGPVPMAFGNSEAEAWVRALEVELEVEIFHAWSQFNPELFEESRIELVQEDNDEFRPWRRIDFDEECEHSRARDYADYYSWFFPDDDRVRHGGDCHLLEDCPVFLVDRSLVKAINDSVMSATRRLWPTTPAIPPIAWAISKELEETRPWVRRENDEFRPLAAYVGRSIWDSSMDSKNPRNQCASGWRYNDCYDDYLGALCQTGGDCQSEAA